VSASVTATPLRLVESITRNTSSALLSSFTCGFPSLRLA
jgi:hypothetical protein